ncbi:hypothetical protein VTJ04DRAFT_7718 [Mycothermus thermophilus]|uniref:uncharacterized protein n=1 Tax=Humicola insolens TaxID=85995 RepID=UPI0037430B86
MDSFSSLPLVNYFSFCVWRLQLVAAHPSILTLVDRFFLNLLFLFLRPTCLSCAFSQRRVHVNTTVQRNHNIDSTE